MPDYKTNTEACSRFLETKYKFTNYFRQFFVSREQVMNRQIFLKVVTVI